VLSIQHCMAGRPRQASRRRLARPPNPDAANAIAIYDGADHVGDCVERDGAHHLFSPSGEWLGACPSRQAAMKAAPTRGCS